MSEMNKGKQRMSDKDVRKMLNLNIEPPKIEISEKNQLILNKILRELHITEQLEIYTLKTTLLKRPIDLRKLNLGKLYDNIEKYLFDMSKVFITHHDYEILGICEEFIFTVKSSYREVEFRLLNNDSRLGCGNETITYSFEEKINLSGKVLKNVDVYNVETEGFIDSVFFSGEEPVLRKLQNILSGTYMIFFYNEYYHVQFCPRMHVISTIEIGTGHRVVYSCDMNKIKREEIYSESSYPKSQKEILNFFPILTPCKRDKIKLITSFYQRRIFEGNN